GGVAGAALALLGATQPWFTVRGMSFGALAVGADIAAPSVTALSVAGLALVGAVAIANTVVRRVLAAIQLLLGLGVLIVTVRALMDPITAVLPTVSTATGVAGSDSLAALVGSVDGSVWPWFSLAGGAVLMLTAAWTFMTARNWPGSGSKYGGQAIVKSPVSDWDALSDGADPTD
ncbi:MAG TPA: Trp biosynthesis-associated membrane protein, partial [Terrimesophilobacter sp.]|nr:Trp biosynthesis-associated membrane protein [Terrimesophilobacter sp.]